MNTQALHSLSGTVEPIEATRAGKITLKDVKFNGNLSALGDGWKCEITGSYQLAKLYLQEGDKIELEASFEALDLEKRFVKISKVINVKKITGQTQYITPPVVYDTDYSRNPLLETPDLSIEEILGNDHPYLENIESCFEKGYTYERNLTTGMNIIADVSKRPNDFAFNALKSTRVGATTNLDISGLAQGLKLVVFVTNNSVMDAVEKAYNNFVKLTGDKSKTFRKIQSNERVCQIAQALIENNGAVSDLPFMLKGNCKECGIKSVVSKKVADVIKTDKVLDQRVYGKECKIEKIQLHPTLPEGGNEQCYQKAMINELLYLQKEGFELAYDLTVITLDKVFALMKSDNKNADLLLEVIGNADVLIFDEFGQYLSKQQQGVDVWERKEMIDTTDKKEKKKLKKRLKKKTKRRSKKEELPPTPITNIKENLEEIEKTMFCVKGFNYDIIRPIFNEFLDGTKGIIEEKRTFRRIRNPLKSTEYGEKRYYDLSGDYLFEWDNDNERLIEFLKNEYKIKWANIENIRKTDDGSTIIVSNEEESLSLKLNDEKTKVNLKINDEVDEFPVKIENGKVNVYSVGDRLPPGIGMPEILENFFWNNYSKFEDNINSENRDDIQYLISLMMVLMSEELVFHHSINKKWIKNKKTKHQELFKIETLRLFPGDDVLVKNINLLIGKKQKVIFTDATTPPFRFNKIKRDVMNVIFGDPLGTNKQLLVIQDNTLYNFDNMRWHMGTKDTKNSKSYKDQVINKLIKIIKTIGDKNIKIWAPNKAIAKEFVVLLNKKKRNMSCTPEFYTTPGDRVIVDWMRSSGSRGVESDRRMHIIVGNPDVPKAAYEYLAFMYPDTFDTIPEQVLENIAKAHNISLQKVREIIGTFHTPEYLGKTPHRKETPDAIESELISIISDQLRIFLVGGDGWQAGSRAKDPSAENPSVLYLLGWSELPALNMVQWGYDLQILGGHKTIDDMKTIIAPPVVIQGSIKDADDWLKGKKRDPTLLLSKDFGELDHAIIYTIAYSMKSTTSKEIWPNISPNLQVGYDSEDHKNGFFVAMNRCLKSDFIGVTETAPGEFTYNFGTTKGIDIPDPDMKLIRKVVHTAYQKKKKEVKVDDITQNIRSKQKAKSKKVKKPKKADKRIEAGAIKRAFRLIKKHKLFNESSWKIEQYEIKKGINKGNHLKIVKNQNAIGRTV